MAPLEESLLEEAWDWDSEMDSEALWGLCLERKLRILLVAIGCYGGGFGCCVKNIFFKKFGVYTTFR